jgi:hypothetical protein
MVNHPQDSQVRVVSRTLTHAARGLARACPSLRLITFCTDHSVDTQYSPRTHEVEHMVPLTEVADALDGRRIRFWLPPNEMLLEGERYHGPCTKDYGLYVDEDE